MKRVTRNGSENPFLYMPIDPISYENFLQTVFLMAPS